MKTIGEGMLIPISLALAIIGAAVWLGALGQKVETTALAIGNFEAKQQTYSDVVQKIFLELAEIRGEIKRIKR